MHRVKSHQKGGTALKANALGIDPMALRAVMDTGMCAHGHGQAFDLEHQARDFAQASLADRQRGLLKALALARQARRKAFGQRRREAHCDDGSGDGFNRPRALRTKAWRACAPTSARVPHHSTKA